MKTLQIQKRFERSALSHGKSYIEKEIGSFKKGDTVLISEIYTLEQREGEDRMQAKAAFKAGERAAISTEKELVVISGAGQSFEDCDGVDVCRFYFTRA